MLSIYVMSQVESCDINISVVLHHIRAGSRQPAARRTTAMATLIKARQAAGSSVQFRLHTETPLTSVLTMADWKRVLSDVPI